MMDQLIAIKDKILDFWNKYTSKQKTIIICVVLAIFFALVLLGYFWTRPVYTQLVTLSGDTASEFDAALSGEGIKYKKESNSNGNTIFSVEQSRYSDAVLLMGENKISSEGGCAGQQYGGFLGAAADQGESCPAVFHPSGTEGV